MKIDEVNIPKTMSTQHPDNVNVPQWCNDQVIDGNAEVHEAFYAYETLGCQEVMWDSEGKDVDTRVLRNFWINTGNILKITSSAKTFSSRTVFLTQRLRR